MSRSFKKQPISHSYDGTENRSIAKHLLQKRVRRDMSLDSGSEYKRLVKTFEIKGDPVVWDGTDEEYKGFRK